MRIIRQARGYGKGDSYLPVSELVGPLGVAIDEIADIVEEKETGETSIDNQSISYLEQTEKKRLALKSLPI